VERRIEVLKLVGIATFWLSMARFLPDALAKVLPTAVLSSLTLPTYNMLCQLLMTGVGLAAAGTALARPWKALGIQRPSGWHLGFVAALAPALFVVASFVALKIAEPYLMEELLREGAGASRRNAGAFGKAVTEAPLLVTLVWGAFLAAIAEELTFRGALFAAVQESAKAIFNRVGHAERRERDVGEPDRVHWVSGALAMTITAAVFGAMHADMRGSVGIVRVASSAILGLACGSARLATGAIFAPMLLHFVYNSVSVGLGRGIFRADSDPLLSVVPNRLLGLAVVAIVVAVGAYVARRASRAES
jgi:membrane protease YdiL (CAAX protease family)